ncbi:aspartate aminotransferase family protein [Natronospirillum operosum]|uniref:Aspartate aminotransferase family protein n=1 Tax=Natronospirillum operosum TaxID=2759953 RepID=A0A4Z0W3Y2_9GAMM|nr:aspartate aminotransferase family protein [Natronospirillum operosum]TGG91452.1 aspartate aminotransferase family protein [Natronospirillum operosum]
MTGTAQWQQQAREHLFQPFVDNAALQREGARVITRAEGACIWDSDGNRFLDAFAGLWCVNIGYGRPELAAVAARQMQELPYYNLFFKTVTPPVAELAAAIAELAPAHMNRVFFTNSGSEANDSVYRMVRLYWQLQEQPERQVIIARHNAYHGSTVAGASLGGMAPMHRQGGLPIPGIEHIQQPYWFDEGGDLSPEEFGLQAARALEERILAVGPEKVAAFIAEPIQGAGGVIIPPATYWPEIQRIVRKYNILLVVDEVICGFGRTGEWFGSDYYDLQPDLMPIAKGLSSGYAPIGGVIMADDFATVLAEKAGDFNHGFTYSGHPVSAAVALENLRILRAEGIVTRVREHAGPRFRQCLQQLADHPMVGEVRAVGLLGAVELVRNRETRERFPQVGQTGALCRDLALEEGLVLRATGDTLLFSPPLILNDQQMDEIIKTTKSALDRAWAQLNPNR